MCNVLVCGCCFVFLWCAPLQNLSVMLMYAFEKGLHVKVRVYKGLTVRVRVYSSLNVSLGELKMRLTITVTWKLGRKEKP